LLSAHFSISAQFIALFAGIQGQCQKFKSCINLIGIHKTFNRKNFKLAQAKKKIGQSSGLWAQRIYITDE
jgi:hypothetical protein